MVAVAGVCALSQPLGLSDSQIALGIPLWHSSNIRSTLKQYMKKQERMKEGTEIMVYNLNTSVLQ